MSAFESGLEAIVLLVLGDELAFGQAFLMDVLRMQRGPAVGQEAHQERRAEFELLRIVLGGL